MFYEVFYRFGVTAVKGNQSSLLSTMGWERKGFGDTEKMYTYIYLYIYIYTYPTQPLAGCMANLYVSGLCPSSIVRHRPSSVVLPRQSI